MMLSLQEALASLILTARRAESAKIHRPHTPETAGLEVELDTARAEAVSASRRERRYLTRAQETSLLERFKDVLNDDLPAETRAERLLATTLNLMHSQEGR